MGLEAIRTSSRSIWEAMGSLDNAHTSHYVNKLDMFHMQLHGQSSSAAQSPGMVPLSVDAGYSRTPASSVSGCESVHESQWP